MELLNISNLSKLHITNTNVSLSIIKISQNILDGLWTFENIDKTIKINKLYIEKLAFSIMRNLPTIKITMLSYEENNIQKNSIINSEKQLIGLIFYLLGVIPKKDMTIKEILKAIADNDFNLLERTTFYVKNNTTKLDITFDNLSPDIKHVTAAKEIAVSICNINVVTEEILNFTKTSLLNQF